MVIKRKQKMSSNKAPSFTISMNDSFENKRPTSTDGSSQSNNESLSYILQRNTNLERQLKDALVRIAKLESQNEQLEDESRKNN